MGAELLVQNWFGTIGSLAQRALLITKRNGVSQAVTPNGRTRTAMAIGTTGGVGVRGKTVKHRMKWNAVGAGSIRKAGTQEKSDGSGATGPELVRHNRVIGPAGAIYHKAQRRVTSRDAQWTDTNCNGDCSDRWRRRVRKDGKAPNEMECGRSGFNKEGRNPGEIGWERSYWSRIGSAQSGHWPSGAIYHKAQRRVTSRDAQWTDTNCNGDCSDRWRRRA